MKVIHCLHCQNKTQANIIASKKILSQDSDHLTWDEQKWNLISCPICHEVTLEYTTTSSEDFYYDDNGDEVHPETTITLYPTDKSNQFPTPTKDLPPELVDDYNEARSIAHLSPRGAAGLLRLLLQKLGTHLGAKGKNIDDDIKYLVAKGLPQELQKAFDIVRIIGNEAVHPGTIDLKDDIETVTSLFKLINIIVEDLISKPKRIAELYSTLPPNKLKAIEERDKIK